MTRSTVIRIAVVFLGITAVAMGVWYGMNLHLEAGLTGEIHQLQTEESTTASVLTHLKREVQHSSNSPTSTQVVPSGPDEAGILEALQTSTERAGVGIQTLSFSSSQSSANQIVSPTGSDLQNRSERSIHVSVQLTGVDKRLTRFLDDLPLLSRKANVISVDYAFGKDMIVDGLVLQLSFPYR